MSNDGGEDLGVQRSIQAVRSGKVELGVYAQEEGDDGLANRSVRGSLEVNSQQSDRCTTQDGKVVGDPCVYDSEKSRESDFNDGSSETRSRGDAGLDVRLERELDGLSGRRAGGDLGVQVEGADCAHEDRDVVMDAGLEFDAGGVGNDDGVLDEEDDVGSLTSVVGWTSD